MSYRLKKLFAGKFCVMSDGTADAEQVYGPATMAECQAWVAEREGSPQPAAASAPADEMDEATARRKEREWAKKVASDLKKPLDDELAEIKAVLKKRRTEDEVDHFVRVFGPLLATGIEGARRERHKFIQPVRSAAA